MKIKLVHRERPHRRPQLTFLLILFALFACAVLSLCNTFATDISKVLRKNAPQYSLPLPNWPIYWINLEKSTDRRRHMEAVFSETSPAISHIRVQATDKAAIQDMLRKRQFEAPSITLKPFSMEEPAWKTRRRNEYTFSEAGCLVSHLNIIGQAYDAGQNMILVLEDDAVLQADFLAHWQSYIDLAPVDWQILQLFTNNMKVVEQGIRLDDPWISWQADHWGTMAYFINRAGMRSILEHTRSPLQGWRLDEPGLIAADELLGYHATTYTATFPWFRRHNFASMIQQGVNGSFAVDRFNQFYRDRRALPLAYMPRKETVLVIQNIFIVHEDELGMELDRLRTDVLALSHWHPTSAWIVTIVLKSSAFKFDQQDTDWPHVTFHVEVRKDRYNKFEFVRPWVSKFSSYDCVLLKDADQRLAGFPWNTFMDKRDNAVIAGPLRQVVEESLVRSKNKRKRQWFQIHDAGGWKHPRSFQFFEDYGSLSVKSVPFIEQYFVLLDGAFAEWFFAQILADKYILDSSGATLVSDLGSDYIWCGAATQWNNSTASTASSKTATLSSLNSNASLLAKRPACVLVPVISLHEDTRSKPYDEQRAIDMAPVERYMLDFPEWVAHSNAYRRKWGGVLTTK